MKRMGMDSGRRELSPGHLIRRLSIIGSALLLISSIGIAAQAGPIKKQFSADVRPGIVNGSLGLNNNGFVTFTASVTNQNASQQLGSAQFSVPSGSGFVIADASTTGASDPGAPGMASPYRCDLQPASSTTPCAEIENGGSTIEFDNLSLLNGSTFTATFSASVPAECKDQLPWTVLSHQANNFSAKPGNFYTGPAIVPTTTVVTTCSLIWTVQPTDAKTNATITGDAGNESGNKITVTVENSVGTTIVGANIPISLVLNDLDATGGTLGGTTPETASSGVAQFAPKISAVGDYELQAVSTGVACSEGGSPTCGTSGIFTIVNDIAACKKGVSCSTQTIQKGSLSVFTQVPNPPDPPGHVIVAVGISNLQCDGYTAVNPTVTFDYLPPKGGLTAAINGTYAIPHSSSTQICFFSITPFTPKTGFTLEQAPFRDGKTYYYAVIDNCKKTAAPCYKVSTGQQIDTFTIVGRESDDMKLRG